ncbi:MAG TPA: hypothetical protein VJQ83_01985, partial [Tepidiformaceae bacterium]|nr:hypothetical protein [Tepidiformaceae bacterium]
MAVTGAAVFLVLAFWLTRKLSRGAIFNPLVAFCGVWFLDLALFEMDRLFRLFYVPLSSYAASLLLLSFALVFVGSALGMLSVRNVGLD